jgi:hypothetical protein
MAEYGLFPSILPDKEFVDDSYHREELANMDWDELRGIAKEHPTEEVNGQSEREEIIDVLTGKQRV